MSLEISCAFPSGPEVASHARLAEQRVYAPMGSDVPRELRSMADALGC